MLFVTAVVADIDMVAKLSGSTHLNIPHHGMLFWGETVCLPVVISVCLKNIRDFQFGTCGYFL
jgi:hypothetical protein